MSSIPLVSIVIVNYNTSELTRRCLESIMGTAMSQPIEIVIVDNASTDNFKQVMGDFYTKKSRLPIHFIENAHNEGFSTANNQGIKIASGRYILLLNSDTEIQNDSIPTLVRFMDAHPDVGASTVKILLPNGNIDPACHRGFPTPWAALTYFLRLEKLFPNVYLFGQYHQGYKDLERPHEVDAISGACFFIRKNVINEVGSLDEAYFMYGEDIDWCYRIKKKGWKIYYIPDSFITHHKKMSGRANIDQSVRRQAEKHFYKTMLLFYRKHYAKEYSPFVNFLVETALWFKIRLIDK